MQIKIKEIDTLTLISNIVCKYYNTKISVIVDKSTKKDPKFAFIRYQIFYFHKMYSNKGISLTELANKLNLSGHADVIYGIKKVEQYCKFYKDIEYDITLLTSIINSEIRINKLTNSYKIHSKIHKTIKNKTNGKHSNKIKRKN